ncbi:sulfatase-like hydrolase/transferase [Cellulophaga lytica]|uniref:Sulfatase n=1 Tax=Cellulophaga lytica (strain ATCC 23178 / DSM 7489 / JCM 8516 / NBRC 14961 / NCIMB 1423 / VKM B-1433 / Cy l20) TaxID=867900 RepID=F0R9E6_CELLC|nr:sulfatase-like hydrolase/transferase [Cellulophaga lytica]ADY28268.1 sulfatase [Cellulophaga lytica DSM 7489]WQG77551.1 sulfatase-like hydrolase/transferase [Cellulophaga lytica]
MRKYLIYLLFYVPSTLSTFSQTNILFIESDDQSNQAIGAYGNTFMVTPNLDKLAEEGTSFTAAYNMGCWSPAVCIPSRTMLMYGKYLWKSQKINKQNAPKSFPEKLHNNGYHTYITGKWHAMGKSVKNIFDETGTIQPGQLKTYNSPAGHITDITANEAINFIKNYSSKKPFFAYVAFNAPHVPRQTTQNYYDLYPVDKVKLPPSVVDNTPLNTNVKYQYTNNPLSAKTMQKRVQQNNAMVTHMDTRIGDIINTLKEKGIYNNTIIVFTSDHGINFGENGVAGKVCLYEPSVTAPLIIKAPTVKQNNKITARVYLQDVVPTLFSLLKIKDKEATDFKSLMPLLINSKKTRESIYLAMFNDQRSIIHKNNKLILYPKTGTIEMYNLKKDPWETNNISAIKRNQKTIKDLLTRLKKWQIKTDDETDLSIFYNQYN